jgi:ABC-2 type transport system permease protein
MQYVSALYSASIREYFRDRLTLFWTLAFPIIFIVLFGLIFSNSGNTNYTVGLVNEDTGATGQMVQSAFQQVKAFTIKTGTYNQELDNLKAGKLDMVVVIPANLSADAQQNATSMVQVWYDPSRATDAQIKLSIVQSVLGAINQQASGKQPLLSVAPQTVQTNTLNAIDFLVPGILAMSLMQLGLFGTAGPLVSLRERKILRRLGATPLPRWTVLVSQVLLRLTISAIQIGLILFIGSAFFKVQIANLLPTIAIAALGAAAFISFGYFLASVSRTQESVAGITQAVNFPMLFLSGIFFPLAALPNFLQPIVKIIPVTYLADALRQVMVNGIPSFSMTTDILVLLGWVVACTALSIPLFKWE